MIRRYSPDGNNASALEIDCSQGALLYFAREHDYRNVRGVDGSPEQVAAVQRLGIEDVEDASLTQVLKVHADESLGVVAVFDVIEYFIRDVLILSVYEVQWVHRPGWRWVIHLLNGNFTHELANSCFRPALTTLIHLEEAPVVQMSRERRALGAVVGFLGSISLFIAAETGNASNAHILSQNVLTVATKCN